MLIHGVEWPDNPPTKAELTREADELVASKLPLLFDELRDNWNGKTPITINLGELEELWGMSDTNLTGLHMLRLICYFELVTDWKVEYDDDKEEVTFS